MGGWGGSRGAQREPALAQHRGHTFLPGTPAEWAGLFIFGVGVYGATYRPVTRHLALWGVVPLDWFYLGLLLLGAVLMLFGGDRPGPDEPPPTRWDRFFMGARLGLALSLLATLVWWAVFK